MKAYRLLTAISVCLPALLVFASTSSSAADSKLLDSFVQDVLALAENFDSGVRQSIQESIKAAVEQITASKDKVLHTAGKSLLKIGSTLHANFNAWQRLEAFDYEKHVNGQTFKVDDPVAKKALSEAVLDCTSLELLVFEQIVEAQLSLEAAIREQRASGDRRKLDAKYGPLHKFFLDLRSYISTLEGQTELIHRKRMLEASVSQGNMTTLPVLSGLNEKLRWFYDALDRRFADVLSTARKCQESGLLPEGVVAFIVALNEL